jgi:hypothetical protein
MTTREGVYIPDDYYLLCEICGFKKRRSECVADYEGKIVCADTCNDEENPQDHIEIHPEEQNVLDARYAEPRFVSDNEIQPEDL